MISLKFASLRMLTCMLIALGTFAAFSLSSSQAEASTRFPSCKSLLKTYPNGIAKDKRTASKIVRNGYASPQVSKTIYKANAVRLDNDRNGVLCEQRGSTSGNSGAYSQTRNFCEGKFVIDAWDVPSYCDQYLDSYRIRSWCQGAVVIHGDVPSYCRKFL
jgi:hypothetical protein